MPQNISISKKIKTIKDELKTNHSLYLYIKPGWLKTVNGFQSEGFNFFILCKRWEVFLINA